MNSFPFHMIPGEQLTKLKQILLKRVLIENVVSTFVSQSYG